MKGRSASPKKTESERAWRRLGRQARGRVQRARQARALRSAGDMFAQVFRYSPMAMLVTRLQDGLILEANAAFERLTRFPRRHIQGRTAFDLGIWESEQARESVLDALAPPSSLNVFEGAFRTRSGAERLWRVFIEPCDLEGEPCLLTAIEDITEGRKVQVTLQASEERFRTLVENVYEVIYMHDRSDVFTYLGPQTQAILGYSPDELTGKPWTSICPDSPINRQASELTARALETGQPAPAYPVEVITKDGRSVLLEVRERPFRDGQGQIVGLVGSARDITEKQAADAALVESRRMLSTLMDSLHGMAYRRQNDPEWTVEFVSRGALALTGYAPEDLVRSAAVSYGELIHPEDQNRVWVAVQDSVDRNRPFQLQYRIRTAAGEEKTVWEHGHGVYAPDGSLLVLEGLIVDVTDRLAVEEALRQSEARHRLLLEHAGLGIGYYDENGRILLYNRVAADHMGGAPEDFIGKSLEELFEPEAASRYLGRIRTAAQAAGSHEYEDSVPLPTGAKWFSSVYTRIPGASAELLGVQVISADITERKRAEEALRQSEERFRFLFESAPDAYYLSDLEGIFLAGNKAAEELIGHGREELIGQSFLMLDLLSPEDLPRAAGLLASNIQGEATGPDEFELRRKDGSRVSVEIQTVPIHLGGQPCVLGIARDISERRRAEQALRESEARLRAVVGASPDITLVLDEDGRYIEILTSSAGLLYSPREELLGRLQREVLPPEVAEAVEQAIRRVLETGDVQVVEYQLNVAEGRRWFEARLAPLAMPVGDKRTVVSVVRDVTSQKNLGAALEERARQLALVNQTAQGLVGTLDLEGVLEHAARIIHGSFDYHQVCIFLREGEHMVLRANAGRFAAELPPRHRLALGQGMVGWVGQTGESLLTNNVSLEPRFYNPLSHDRLQSAITIPIRWGGKVIGVLDVESEDLDAFSVNDAQVLDTLADQLAAAVHNAQLYQELEAHSQSLERVVAERTEEVRRSAKRVNVILDNSPDAIVFLGSNGAIESGNRAFEMLFGYPAAIVVGQLPTMLLAPAHVPRLVEAIDQTIAENRPVRFEAVAEREDGVWFDVDVALGPVAETGLAPGIVCSLRDITEIKQVERMKDAFVSNVSHELRTPITSMRLNAGLLRMDPGRQSVYLERLMREVDRLSGLIEDLLRLSRLDQGRVKLDLKVVDLNMLVAHHVEDRTPLAESKGLHLQFEALDGMPPVAVDSGLVGQVISILLNNAINYTPGSGKITVRTLVHQEGGRATAGFSVSDTGPGIDVEDRRHIYERFYRGKVGRDSGMPGTGLGLSIAKEIVERHRGRIDLETPIAEGAGCTFMVWLPTQGVDETP